MCDKREVERLYFEEKLSCADIAKAVGISHQAVSKILKKNPEYKNEKERRKKENKLKHNKQIADCVKRKRKRLREEEREKDIEIFVMAGRTAGTECKGDVDWEKAQQH